MSDKVEQLAELFAVWLPAVNSRLMALSIKYSDANATEHQIIGALTEDARRFIDRWPAVCSGVSADMLAKSYIASCEQDTNGVLTGGPKVWKEMQQ